MGEILWGANAYNFPTPNSDGLTAAVELLLTRKDLAVFYPLLVAGQFCGILLVFFRHFRAASLAIVYISTQLLNTSAGLALNGGDNLAILLLFFLIFMSPLRGGDHRFSPFRIAASNAALYAARVQILLVYLSAGVLKLSGGMWQKGVALYYIAQVAEFHNAFFFRMMSSSPALLTLGTYFAVLFQLIFPILIWRNSCKAPLFLMGLGFHFLIGVCMGLPFFGAILPIAYLLFFPDSWSLHILQKISKEDLGWVGKRRKTC
jgi:hypothetical protein